jgi:hypothetical protein
LQLVFYATHQVRSDWKPLGRHVRNERIASGVDQRSDVLIGIYNDARRPRKASKVTL